eukprot:485000-Rhodomonas_salina.2
MVQISILLAVDTRADAYRVGHTVYAEQGECVCLSVEDCPKQVAGQAMPNCPCCLVLPPSCAPERHIASES